VTDHEIQLLALGMQIMLLVQVAFGALDDRRDRKAARATVARLEAARKRADA